MGTKVIESVDGHCSTDIHTAMWHKKLTITYVDGEVIACTTREWPEIRADGIDFINFDSVQLAGESIYYLYPEQIKEGEFAWVCGGFCLYDSIIEEYILRIEGERLNRKRRDLPDIQHNQLKLGWWRQNI